MVEPSPGVVSQVKVAALAVVELAARNKADAAIADSDDAIWGFMRVFVGLVFEGHQSMKLRCRSAS